MSGTAADVANLSPTFTAYYKDDDRSTRATLQACFGSLIAVVLVSLETCPGDFMAVAYLLGVAAAADNPGRLD
jgi:hypothetical protein